MPWVRIDEHALSHFKVLRLSHGAFRLWVEGLAHCQRHLTDGFISGEALQSFRYQTRGRLNELAAGLWEATNDGYRVHDYLQWNDPKDRVEAKRERARDRWQRFSQRRGNAVANGVANAAANAQATDIHSTPHHSSRSKEQNVKVSPTAERAGNFCEWYAETHQRLIGVAYIGNPHRDWEAALGICDKLSDDEARAAATVWFGMDDDFARNGTRTISKFASRASDCVARARKALGVA